MALPAPRMTAFTTIDRQTTIPPVIHASRESREVGLKHYTAVYLRSLHLLQKDASRQKKNYKTSKFVGAFVDLKADTFYYGSGLFCHGSATLPPANTGRINQLRMTESLVLMSMMDYRLPVLTLAQSVAINSFLWETLLNFAEEKSIRFLLSPQVISAGTDRRIKVMASHVQALLTAMMSSKVLKTITIFWSSCVEGVGKQLQGDQDLKDLEFVAGDVGCTCQSPSIQTAHLKALYEAKKAALGWQWEGEFRFGYYKHKE
jgi:hypothetical protein